MSTDADPLPASLIGDALARFGLRQQARVTFIRHGENTTYRITATDGRRLALRIHRPGYQTLPAIRSELAWMASLRGGGVLTAAPVPGIDGNLVQTATGDDGSARTAVLFEWLDGVPINAVGELEPWERLGELVARIHSLTARWRPPAWFTRPAWDAQALVGEDPRWGPPDPHHALAPADAAALEACRVEVLRRLERIGAGADRFGLIHADLGFENVLVSDDGTVAIIDFDDCGESWYMLDFAVALYPHSTGDGFGERRDALIMGYRRTRELPDELLAELPTFLMARRIQTLGWLFSRSETAHAARQHGTRLRSTPRATRDYLAWARANPS